MLSSHEPISNPELGQRDARSRRVDLDLLAQVANNDPQIVRVVEMRAAPDVLHDLLPRHDLAGVLRENLQHQIFLRPEDQPLAAERAGTSGQIDFKRTDRNDGIAARHGRARPQRGARPRDSSPIANGLTT